MTFSFRNKNLIVRLKHLLFGVPLPVNRDVVIGGISIGRNHRCFFIAEIGINHNGSIDTAKKLIDVAAAAGAQAVKFQKRTILAIYSSEELEKPVPVDRAVLENAIRRGVLPEASVKRLKDSDFSDTRRGDYVWAREFVETEYRELFAYAKEKGVLVFASPWDLASVDFMERLDPPCHKIASASLTDAALLRRIHATGRPVILSTGMSTPEQIQTAVKILNSEKLILLHAVSTYPSVDSDLNLRAIVKLRKAYPTIPIGYSGHEKGTGPSFAAVMLGARVVERHVTLDRTMFGTDQSASLEPQEFARLISDVRSAEDAIGDGIKRVIPSEVPIMRKLRKV